MEFSATCPTGLEQPLADELRRLHCVKHIRPLKGMVTFEGEPKDAYKVCLWSRLASRILMVIDRIGAYDAEDLYEGVFAIPWEVYMSPKATFAVDAKGTNDSLHNTLFTTLKVKDAVVDRMVDACGKRPDVSTDDPDIRIRVTVRESKATVYLDFAGEPLFYRGYQTSRLAGAATLRKDFAAAAVYAAGLTKPHHAQQTVFIDPFCSAGDIALEAAQIAADRAPGLLRSRWGFEGWSGFQESDWFEVLDEADSRAEQAGLNRKFVFVTDTRGDALAQARENCRFAGVESLVGMYPNLEGIVEAIPEGFKVISASTLVGADAASMPVALGEMAELLRLDAMAGSTMAIIAQDDSFDAVVGIQPTETSSIRSGSDSSEIRVYHREADVEIEAANELTLPDGSKVAVIIPQSDQFANRLHKVAKLRRKWGRKQGITCMRIYDADLPDYAVAIDLYTTDRGIQHLVIAEYQAPKEIDPEIARKRFFDVLTIAPRVLGVDPQNVHARIRTRAKGGSQYGARNNRNSEKVVVEEAGLSFEVNFSDYLDTGLFLDHRLVRAMIRDRVSDGRFLNLFAYTSTATVYAAEGGSRETTTVDMSKTYLDWGKRNMALNGFEGQEDIFIHADVLEWIQETRHTRFRWDLIYVDPPTFSNSSRMSSRSFEIQRDHVELLIGVSRLLTREGSAIFSCNLRGFKPDFEALEKAGVVLEDVTAESIPEDFARNAKIHHCYILRRVEV